MFVLSKGIPIIYQFHQSSRWSGSFCVVLLEFKGCSASGDPHYHTFDGATIHFMGICKYTLAKPCEHLVGELPMFKVEVKNERREGKKPTVAFTKIVDVKVYNHVVSLMKDGIVLVSINFLFCQYCFPLIQQDAT